MDYLNYSPKMMPFQGLTGFGGGATGLGFGGGVAEADPAFYGDRAVWAGGYDNTNEISYVQIPTTGNSTTFGNAVVAGRARGPATNGSRGLYMGGRQMEGGDKQVDYITIGTPGNAADFGNMSGEASNGYGGGTEGGTDIVRAVAAGGYGVTNTKDIEYFTILTLGNSTDLADLDCGKTGNGCITNGTRMVVGGANDASSGCTYVQMDYKNIMDSSNAQDFGDLTTARGYIGATQSLAGRGIFGAGSNDETMDYVTIGSTGNATDFGNAPNMKQYATGWTCSDVRGVVGGSNNEGNGIKYITFANTGNTSDFGDFATNKSFRSGVSGN